MSQLNCFIFVCKKSKLKEGLKRWTNQAFWFLSSILTSPKNILTPRSHACFPCRTGGHTHTPLEKGTRFKTNYYIYAYVRALSSNVRATNFVHSNVNLCAGNFTQRNSGEARSSLHAICPRHRDICS